MNLLKNKHYNFHTYYCGNYLTKNGKLLYTPTNRFYSYICILKKIIYLAIIKFPDLYGINEDEIVYKLLLISYCKKKNLKYIKIDKNRILLFNGNIKNIEDIVLNFYIINNSNPLSSESWMLNNFIFKRFLNSKKITNDELFIKIFYEYVIRYKKDFEKIYNIIYDDIQNYNELYKKLKKIGYVKFFYNQMVPYILKNYKKTYKDMNESLKNKRKKYIKKIKNFSTINIMKLIDKDIIINYNKTYIKNKFIELSKKYNI